MIPVSIFRILLVLLSVSGTLVLVDSALANIGIRGELAKAFSGLLAGGVVFFLAYEWGRILRFCGKDFSLAAEDSLLVNDALSRLSIPSDLLRVTLIESDNFHGITVREGGRHRLFLSTKYLQVLSPGGLRGLLSHEYGHVENHHPIKLAVILGLTASVKLSVGIPLGAVVAILLAYLFMLREWEYVADKAAVHRTGACDVIAAFEDYQRVAGEEKLSRLSELFCGHPSVHRRIRSIQQLEGGV